MRLSARAHSGRSVWLSGSYSGAMGCTTAGRRRRGDNGMDELGGSKSSAWLPRPTCAASWGSDRVLGWQGRASSCADAVQGLAASRRGGCKLGASWCRELLHAYQAQA